MVVLAVTENRTAVEILIQFDKSGAPTGIALIPERSMHFNLDPSTFADLVIRYPIENNNFQTKDLVLVAFRGIINSATFFQSDGSGGFVDCLAEIHQLDDHLPVIVVSLCLGGPE